MALKRSARVMGGIGMNTFRGKSNAREVSRVRKHSWEHCEGPHFDSKTWHQGEPPAPEARVPDYRVSFPIRRRAGIIKLK